MSDEGTQRGSEAGDRNGRVRTFRDLVAWQRGMEVAECTYHATKQLPASELYGLTSQMRRSAVSIPSNVAEGFARQSRSDYLRQLRIARGSLAELATQYELAIRVGLLSADPQLADLIEEESRILNGLIRALEAKELR